MKRIKILVVDDDSEILRFLTDFLQENEFETFSQNNGENVLEEIEKNEIDLLIIDLKLAGMNGLDISKKVAARYDIPIIMISGVNDDIEKIVGLESGLDDFIDKPFNPRLLLARIRSRLRRSNITQKDQNIDQEPLREVINSDLSFGDFFLNSKRCTLYRESEGFIELTNTEFRLLEYFVKHAGQIISRQDLSDELGLESSSYMMRSIDVLILRLRRKIELIPSKPKYLQTRRNRGYMFVIESENKNE
ncbi:response regulator [Marinomonas colpomeniae]|uniref:Response regulator transcription factor n=1 Tax=Marinomonas colpomeniae TaxID=2774408 RepID=A0ABR8NU00_9GAMM|nr:response regulator transcription factor [Marinomonas colpomeniae]MBD5769527.1 response regulator transcription factor [Marinomonas colpomeniae]